MRRKTIFIFFLVVLTLPAMPHTATAASHFLTKYEHDNIDDVGYFDLVISLDWEPTVGDRSRRLQTAFEQLGRDVFIGDTNLLGKAAAENFEVAIDDRLTESRTAHLGGALG